MSHYQRTHKKGSSAKKKSSSSKTSTTPSPSRPFTSKIHSPAHDYIMHLQRTIGNRAVERLWKSGWLQRKLNIGPSNDKYEQEADTVAEKVVSMDNPETSSVDTVGKSPTGESKQIFRTPLADSITPLQRSAQPEEDEAQKAPTEEEDVQKAPTKEDEELKGKFVQRKCASCEKEEEGQMQKSPVSDYPGLSARERDLQRKGLIPLKMPGGSKLQTGVNQAYRQKWLDDRTAPVNTFAGKLHPVRMQQKEVASSTPAGLESSINTARGSGKSLSSGERSYYEPRFGTSFEGVKIHTDSKAAQLSRSVNARAFTTGNDIYFGAGEYSPNSIQGKRLMAHELTHTVQQGGQKAARHSIQQTPDQTIQRQSIHNPLFPCYDTSLLAGGTAYFGTWVHLLIQQYYVSMLDPMAAAEYMIPGSSLVAGRTGRADIVDSTGGIYEIKPYPLAAQGLTEAANYLLFAELACDPMVNWHLGYYYFVPPLVLNGELIRSWLHGPGVIVYTRTRIPDPVYVPEPVPQTDPKQVPVVDPSTYELILEFARSVVESGADATQAANEFLQQHPEIAWTVILLGMAAIILLAADDVTLVGIADDVLMIPIGALIRASWSYAW